MPFAADTNTPPNFAVTGGKLRTITRRFTYASETAQSFAVPGMILPRGAVPIAFLLNTTDSTGSATLAIGITGTTAKYAAAAALTSTNTPTLRILVAAQGVPVTAPEQILLTTAAASLPASGTLVMTMIYADNS